MRAAFKEWGIVVDALETGNQIIILRKGGISEGRGGFSMDHENFWLFPTLFHQQRDMVVAAAQERYDQVSGEWPPADRVRITSRAEVVAWKKIEDAKDAMALAGQHIWRDEVIRERFDWSRRKDIHALAVRVFRLRQPVELPVVENYGGCKSWIELESDLDAAACDPVLGEAEFAEKLGEFQQSLNLV